MLNLLVYVSALLGALAVASPIQPRAPCTAASKLQRRAWHTLSDASKKEYINAELCLMGLKTKTSLPFAVTRFDDLIKSHQIQADIVHEDGWFLPFHRLLMHAHEQLLRNECGYTGAQPYWDEARDAGRFTSSVIFSATTGFGGDGVGSGRNRCIRDGPFANYTLNTGPGFENTPHCISRSLSDRVSQGSSQANIDECLALGSYETAWPCIERNPHAGGHGGVGGEMVNPISSPGDPLFYLHHTFLDRVWWQWQARDLPKRLTDIAGYTTRVRQPPPGGLIPAKLTDELNMFGVVPNATVAEVMDIGGERLCFEYV